MEGLGQVVLGGEGLHEVPVAALAQRREVDELAACPDCAGELGAADAQVGGRVALERSEAE